MAKLAENKVYLESSPEAESLTEKGYGEKADGRLELHPFEALYLLANGWLTVVEEATESQVGFQELLNRFRHGDKMLWARYLIYRDLRERGYAVKPGFGLGVDFRVYERGSYGKEAAKYLVYGVFEGEPLEITVLLRAVEVAQSLKKELILGVIERRGEVVYYSLSRFTV